MIRRDVSNSRKARTWEHSMCALGDIEETKNDANTSAVSKLAMVSASGLTPRDHDEAVRRDHGEAEEDGQATQRGTRTKRIAKFRTA